MISFAYAQCQQELKEVDNTKSFEKYFKQSLFLFLSNPDNDILTLNEINQTLKYYFLAPGNIDNNALCAITPAQIATNYNGVNITEVVKKTVHRPESNRIPRCKDGTMYGECSDHEPMFCYSGKLRHKCAGPDNNLSTTDDNCGCPAPLNDVTDCNQATGRCGAVCVNDADCPGTTTTNNVCNGNSLYNIICSNSCNDGVCGPQPDLAVCSWNLISNCTAIGYYCVDGQSTCAQCLTTSDCTYPPMSTCISPTKIQTTPNICNAGFCIPGAPINKTCTGNTKCIDECTKCFDLTTPKHNVSFDPSPIDDQINTNMLDVEIDDIYAIPIGPIGSSVNYQFTHAELYIYRNGALAYGPISRTISGMCMLSSCSASWSNIPFSGGYGNNTFIIRLYNQSGKYWDLPNPIFPQPGYCQGNVTYNIQPFGG